MRHRLLIVEDHPLYRKGLRTLIASVADLEVIGEAGDGAAAVQAAFDLRPDVVLMDLQLPGMSGIAAIREIVAAVPECKVLVVTLFQDDDSVFSALRAGARGYILKDTDEEEMIRAIRAVAGGESLFGPDVARRVLATFASTRPVTPPAFPELTERERDILYLVAQGKANPAIASALNLSPKTVANHVSIVLGKLQVADRAEAIARARATGFAP